MANDEEVLVEVKVIWNDTSIKPLVALMYGNDDVGISVKKGGKKLFIPYTSIRLHYSDDT